MAAPAIKTTTRFSRVHVLQFRQEAVDAEKRVIEGFASTPSVVDVMGFDEVLPTEALAESLPQYMKNPIVTWMHQWMELPIGKTLAVEARDEGLWVQIQIGRSARATEVWEAIDDELLRTLSVGFDAEYSPDHGSLLKDGETARWGAVDAEGGTWVWNKAALREIAVVSLPADDNATFSMVRGLGLSQERPTFDDAPAPTEELDDDERRIEGALRKIAGGGEAVVNMLRHWERTDERPSGRIVSAALDPIVDLVAIARAGKVLSRANRTAVEEAITALQAVLAKDDDSNAKATKDEDSEERSASLLPFLREDNEEERSVLPLSFLREDDATCLTP